MLHRLSALIPVALAFSAQAQVTEMPNPESFKVGDRWEWQQIDTRTRLTEGKRSRSVVSVAGVLHFSDGNVASQISNAFLGRPAKQPWRVWPLEVGRSWEYEADWVRSDGLSGNTKQDVVVAAYEEVSVPAGMFKAFKIEHKGFFSNSKGTRGRQLNTYWYSPEVGADVKETHDDGYNKYVRELVSYTRGSP